jgi:hypothetical protein
MIYENSDALSLHAHIAQFSITHLSINIYFMFIVSSHIFPSTFTSCSLFHHTSFHQHLLHVHCFITHLSNQHLLHVHCFIIHFSIKHLLHVHCFIIMFSSTFTSCSFFYHNLSIDIYFNFIFSSYIFRYRFPP